jgi:hypothetical protein
MLRNKTVPVILDDLKVTVGQLFADLAVSSRSTLESVSN